MKYPLGWLAEWIDLPDLETLDERLTIGGLEIEEVIQGGPDLSALIVGHVDARQQHPDADRLSLCSVDVGGDAPLDIVCGAPNVDAGQKVAVALHGAVLPDGMKIKRSKIRGVKSNGMICSPRELGLSDEHEGILVLDTDAAPGTPLPEVLQPGEIVLDVEITPNRGDWVSMLGMAREVRAHFGGEIRMPETEPEESGEDCAGEIQVSIDDRTGCSRYVARVIRGVRVGPSPDWLVARLEAAGLRSVSNVVDVTNLVMLEFGQPLHAFDLARVRGGEIRVRAAEAGEKLRTLDGQLRELVPADLVIADGEGGIALAGVMGGAESEVGDDTRDVLLESACFDPTRVRRTAKRLGLHSDASYRFERGVDPDEQARAADRAARLIAELAGGSVLPGRVEATGEPAPRTEQIRIEPSRVNRLLGTAIEADEMVALLERLNIAAHREEAGQGEALVCSPPSYRRDLHIPTDLAEEIARVHGFDRIEETLPPGFSAPPRVPDERRMREAARESLAGVGLVELMCFPASPDRDVDDLLLAADDPRRARVTVVNPMQAEENRLRSSLVPSLLRVAQSNLARQTTDLHLFEVSRVFLGDPDGGLPREPLEAAALIIDGGEGLWDARSVPVFFRAKGVAERLLSDLGIEAGFDAGCSEPYLHPGAKASYVAGKREVVQLGELHPDVARAFGIEVPAAVVRADLDALRQIPATPPALEEVSRHPRVRRDLSILLPDTAAAGDVLEAVRKRAGASLQNATIFDHYRGKGVPEGQVSLSLRLDFQRVDRTLTDEEVAKSVDRVVNLLQSQFGGELR